MIYRNCDDCGTCRTRSSALDGDTGKGLALGRPSPENPDEVNVNHGHIGKVCYNRAMEARCPLRIICRGSRRCCRQLCHPGLPVLPRFPGFSHRAPKTPPPRPTSSPGYAATWLKHESGSGALLKRARCPGDLPTCAPWSNSPKSSDIASHAL